MAEIGNVTVKVDAVITDEQYYEAMSAVSAANEYIAALEAENAKLRNEVELTKRMYAKVSEDLCAEQADNERLRQELAIREESEQEKCIEYLRQENIDWEDRYRELAKESDKLRELLQRLLVEYRYMRVRPRRVYMQHEGRMRVIEEEMRELGIEVYA